MPTAPPAFFQPTGLAVRPASPVAREIREGVLGHLESLRVTSAPYGHYRYDPPCQPTLWASAFAAMTRYLLGDLDALTAEQRTEWRDYLIAGQDEDTGLFLDPAFRSEERPSTAYHTDELLFWHSATFILTAIELLGGQHRHPIRAVHKLREPGVMRHFLETALPWDLTPWAAGNWTYDIGCLLGHDHRLTGEPANLAGMDAFFAWHEDRQLPETGWWDLAGGHPVSHQQYGGYHTLMVYWMYDREVPRPEAMIASSLSLQAEEGHFGGNCCADMDVIDAVVTLSRQYGLRERAVADAMERALPHQLSMLVPGSGFKDFPDRARTEFGWKQCSGRARMADPCADLFRSFSVALCAEVLPGSGLDTLGWRHHGTFGHCVRPRALL